MADNYNKLTVQKVARRLPSISVSMGVDHGGREPQNLEWGRYANCMPPACQTSTFQAVDCLHYNWVKFTAYQL
jgi:hypothetical protein